MAYLQGFIEGITPFNAKVGTNLNIEKMKKMKYKTVTIEEMITELQKQKTFADTVFFDGLSAPSRLQNKILHYVYKEVNMQCFKGALPNLREITVSFTGAPPDALGFALGGHIISISTERS